MKCRKSLLNSAGKQWMVNMSEGVIFKSPPHLFTWGYSGMISLYNSYRRKISLT